MSPHIHEKIDITVDTMVVYQDKVLLRKHDKYHKWLMVGGHIELDEDPNQAALREVKEEVGLAVTLYHKDNNLYFSSENYKELIPPVYLNRHRISETHEHVDMVYFAKSNSDKIIQGDSEISEEIKWFSREELKDKSFKIDEMIVFYAQAALETLGEI